MANVLASSRSLPSHAYSQTRLTSEMSKLFPSDTFDPKRLAKFHSSVQVANRNLALPVNEVASWGYESFTERNDAFIKYGLEMIERCTRSALYKAGVKADDVDHIFYVSSTGCSNPSMDIRLLNRFADEYDPDQALGPDVGSFRRTVSRTSIFGVGCAGAGTIMNRATDYLTGHPSKLAVAITLEPFSLTTQYWDTSLANLIGTGLFGDASVAMVLAGDAWVHKRRVSKGIRSASVHGLIPFNNGTASSVSSSRSTSRPQSVISDGRSPFASHGRSQSLNIAAFTSASLRPRFIAGRSFCYRDTEDKIGWDIGSFGFKLILAKDVGDIIKGNILHDTSMFLAETRQEAVENALEQPYSPATPALIARAESMPASVDDIASFVVHPGGPALLDKVAQCFSIIPPKSDNPDDKPLPKTQQNLKGMELSWKSLEDVGNCSSASALMILEDTIKTTVPGTTMKSSLNLKVGDYSMLIGFGPGFCIEMSLMEWVRP